MVSIFASVIIVITLALIVQLTGASTAAEGVLLGLLAGVGFVAATQLPNYMFESRSLKIYVINVGYPVVTFTTIGLLLTVWQQVRDPHQRAVARRGWVCSTQPRFLSNALSASSSAEKSHFSLLMGWDVHHW